MRSSNLGISWQLSDRHGWGVFGYNLALNLIRNGPCAPVLFSSPEFIGAADDIVNKLQSCVCPPTKTSELLSTTPLLHSLGNGFQENPTTRHLRGRANAAFAFFEQAGFSPGEIAKANSWDRLLVGSSWNRDVCLGAGITGARFVAQGVDTNLFCPGPKQGVPSGRFVIYSGGKLEYRKGQDLVLAAFKIFHYIHPDSILVTCWQNSWIESAQTIASSNLIKSSPEQDQTGQIKIADWASANGVADNSFVDLGWVSNTHMPTILREADVAVFPSRCEGGTNLAAMEAMACGVPCILSANTGHLDIIKGDNCYALANQTPDIQELDYWRQSDVDEIVEKLEQAYRNAEARQRRANSGAETMQSLSWDNQVRQLLIEIDDLL